MEKKHSEKEKTSLDSPSSKLNKSMIAYHETGDSNVVGDLIKPQFFIFLWFPICLFISKKKFSKNKKAEDSGKRCQSLLLFI